MKNHFITLFNYDRYANELILKAINDTGSPEKPVQLMAHLLAAQQVWLNRCLGLPPAAVELWPAIGAKHEDLPVRLSNNHGAWIKYLNGLNDGDFEKLISYKNTKGDSFDDQLQNILAHVINHGTHHRAQIGQLLKFTGLENLPNTDFIAYLRLLKN
jgi:uncharacterized damage-inducible protein DinB